MFYKSNCSHRRSPAPSAATNPDPEATAHYNAVLQQHKYAHAAGIGGQYYGPAKEQYPMLSKDHPASESDYTTTLHRRLAVPPHVNSNGVFPDLPPPPPPSSAGGDLCPVHGAYGDVCSGMHTFRPPPIEHIYESPKFERKRPRDSPFYHELEPTSNSDPSDSESTVAPDPTQLPIGLRPQ